MHLRSEHDHRQQAFTAMHQNNAAACYRIEKEHGSRFTAFMELSYFDSVRFHIVDPMHNLYLGTSKYVMKQILNTTSSSGLIQERVDKCIVPSSLGRIPHKISYAYAYPAVREGGGGRHLSRSWERNSWCWAR